MGGMVALAFAVAYPARHGGRLACIDTTSWYERRRQKLGRARRKAVSEGLSSLVASSDALVRDAFRAEKSRSESKHASDGSEQTT